MRQAIRIAYTCTISQEIINRVQEKPHQHFNAGFSMHVKNLRRKTHKYRLNKQLENNTKLDAETMDILDKDFVENIKPHIDNPKKKIFTSDFNRYRIYGSVMLRISVLTGIRASALSNFKTEELLETEMENGSKLYCYG